MHARSLRTWNKITLSSDLENSALLSKEKKPHKFLGAEKPVLKAEECFLVMD